MKKKKETTDEEKIENYIKKLVSPIFEDSLKETSSKRVSVGSHGFQEKNIPNYCFYQPHNFRVFVDYNRATFNPPLQPNKPNHISSVDTTICKLKNRTEVFFFETFNDCRITVKKTQVEIINLKDHKKRYIIDMNRNVRSQKTKIIANKTKECLEALKQFIDKYDGESGFKILNLKVLENKIEHEDFIDKIPLEQTFRNEIVKKDYMEKNAEFSDPAHSCNYLTEQALNQNVPEIHDKLDKLTNILEISVNSQAEQNEKFAENLKSHLELIKEWKEEAVTHRKAYESQNKPKSSYISELLRYLLKNIKQPLDVLNFEKEIRSLSNEDRQRLDHYLFKLAGE